MAWIYLLVAGMFEWGWPIGLKLGWAEQGLRYGWLALAIVSMTVSGILLLLAQREIPVGSAYAVWMGIGAIGTFFLGVWLLGEPLTVWRLASVALILVGTVGLKLA
jgi:quaternary ammonium compound-resistance protein SugE